MSICGLNFSSKFLIQEKIRHIFSLRGISFVWFKWNVCRSALIPRNLPCPVKILVSRLKLFHKSKQTYPSKRDASLKKWSFSLTISSVSVTKPAVSFGFGHIYWRNSQGKTSFLCMDSSEVIRHHLWIRSAKKRSLTVPSSEITFGKNVSTVNFEH